MRVGDFLFEELYVVLDGPDEVDGLEVHQFLPDIFDLLDEVDVILVEFGLCVDDGDDAGGLMVEDESLHLGDVSENVVEVVLGDRQ